MYWDVTLVKGTSYIRYFFLSLFCIQFNNYATCHGQIIASLLNGIYDLLTHTMQYTSPTNVKLIQPKMSQVSSITEKMD